MDVTEGMNKLHDHILEARSLCERGQWVAAANNLLEIQGSKIRVKTQTDAEMGIMGLYHSLLDQGDWVGAALLRWGKTLFNPDPRSVALIWKYLTDPNENKILIMGCGSSGKTYSTSAWINLDWSRDPEYTTFKIVSTTYGHNKSGIMSRIGIFHTQSITQFPGSPVSGGVAYPCLDKAASIMMVAIPEGETGEGRLTGIHPVPRAQPHPVFGLMSRIRFVIDEADVVPEGLWGGVDNALSNENYQGSIKVVALTNPRLKQNSFAHRAEPKDGWASLDEDTETWVSAEGWRVISIDAAKSENVLSKKEIFPGLMTYQGFRNYERKGKDDPKYWTYARGKYPPDSVATFNVFSPSYFDGAVGRIMFAGDVIPVGSFDPAFAEEGDDAVLSLGRFGTAIGFRGEDDRYIDLKPRKMVQVEQQIEVKKGPTHVMAGMVMQMLRSYGVRPEWFCMDKTGNGRGIFDHLRWKFGGSIMGIEWAGKATETKILREDSDTADLRYKGIAAEMWFAACAWLEYGHIKFSPTFEGLKRLRDECCARKWEYTGTLQKLESKKEFKISNRMKSPDRADSFVMLPHVIRINSQGLPHSLTDKPVSGMLGRLQSDESIIDGEIPFLPDHRIM